MRFAYADPPYPGQAKRRYGDHPDYAGEVDHGELVERLETYDGWALSTSSVALPSVLSVCPSTVRVAVWHVTNAEPPGAVKDWWFSWEPVIVRRRGAGSGAGTKNLISCSLPNHGTFGNDLRGPAGQKPRQFCEWVFRLMGATPDDTLDDLFPGSGAVGQAWTAFRAQMTLGVTV